jgi:hypothetical protein
MDRDLKLEEGEQEKPKSTMMGYFSTGLNAVVGTAKSLGQKTKEKFQEAKMGEKMSAFGSKIAEKTTQAASFAYDKTKAAAITVAHKGKELAVPFGSFEL